MRVLDKTIYVYEAEVESTKLGLGKPIFTFNTSITLQDTEDEAPLRMRIRAYYANFYPHSTILKLSQPGNWSEWSDWFSGPDSGNPDTPFGGAAISEAIDSLASIVDPQQQAPSWALKLNE